MSVHTKVGAIILTVLKNNDESYYGVIEAFDIVGNANLICFVKSLGEKGSQDKFNIWQTVAATWSSR